MTSSHVDVLVIAETKIDSSFQKIQFLINGFKAPYRLDVSGNSGGVLVNVKETLISKELDCLHNGATLQVIPFEINIRKQKWVVFAIYKPPVECKKYFVEQISLLLDKYSSFDK